MKRVIYSALLLGLFCLPSFGAASTNPIPRITGETETTDRLLKLEQIEIRGSSAIDIYWTFKENGYRMPLPTNCVPVFEYTYANVTGAVHNAAQGIVKFSLSSTSTATNGVFDFDIVIYSSGGTVLLKKTTGSFILTARGGAVFVPYYPYTMFATAAWVSNFTAAVYAPITEPLWLGWTASNTYVKAESDPVWCLVSNQYAKTSWVDSVYYPRNNPSSYVAHATADGNYYASKDGAWAAVVGTEVDPIYAAWALTHSNAVDYVQSYTSNWDNAWSWVDLFAEGYTNLISWTNSWNTVASWAGANSNYYAYAMGRTSTWDVVADYIANHSNALDYVQVRTGYWDQAYNWVNANSGAVVYAFGRTGTWDLISTYVTAHSNAIDYVQSRSNVWDNAYSYVLGHSNAVDYMEGRTSTWDATTTWLNANTSSITYMYGWVSLINYVAGQTTYWDNAYAYVLGHSNALDYVEGRTSAWDSTEVYVTAKSNDANYVFSRTGYWDNAYSYVQGHSNALDYMEGRTSTWDAIASSGATNAGAGLTDIFVMSGGVWVAVDPAVALITSVDIANWNDAVSWGDHHLEGYATNTAAGSSTTYCMSNGVWTAFTAGSGGGGNVYTTSNNTYSVNTTQTVDKLIAAQITADNYYGEQMELTESIEAPELIENGVSLVTKYATNTAAGSSTTYCMSNGVWSAFTSGSGGGTGDLTKAVADVTYAPISVVNPLSYISGCWPSYVDTNTVSITNGDGYCNGQYFSQTNAVNVDITAAELAGGFAWEWHYIYLDYSASTFPSTLTYYTSTNEPTKSLTKHGWYRGDDRVVGAVMASNTVNVLMIFGTEPTGMTRWKYINPVTTFYGISLADAFNPNSTWQTPTTESSVYLPVNAVRACFAMYGQDADSTTVIGLTSYENSLVVAANYFCGERNLLMYVFAFMNFNISLGPSRNVRLTGQDNDDNAVYLAIHGYQIER